MPFNGIQKWCLFPGHFPIEGHDRGNSEYPPLILGNVSHMAAENFKMDQWVFMIFPLSEIAFMLFWNKY